MSILIRTFSLALLAITMNAGSACAAEPDPAVLSYKLPADLKWSENPTYPGLFARHLYPTALSPERPLHHRGIGYLVGGNR